MLDKNYIFIFVSLILGVIISLYYVKKINNKFIISSLIITIIFYIIFYYLGNTDINKNSFLENYQNNYGTNFYNSNFYNSNFYDNLNQNIVSEENSTNKTQSEENNNTVYDYHNIIASVPNGIVQPVQVPQEETINYRKKWYSPEEDIEENNSTLVTNNIPSEEYNISSEQQNVSKQILSNGNAPININISYNAQNSTNSNNNNKLSQSESIPSNSNQLLNNNQLLNTNQILNRNLGNIGGVGRIYSNSDWIYGTNAWTNSPDYYIPDKNSNNCDNCPKPLNEIVTARKYKENKDVCPLMINTPWTEFKSGDDTPEPYNV